MPQCVVTRESEFTIRGHFATTELLRGPPKAESFRDSAVENLVEFFERFRHLNIRSIEQLDALVEQAQRIVRGVESQQLRDTVRSRGFSLVEVPDLELLLIDWDEIYPTEKPLQRLANAIFALLLFGPRLAWRPFNWTYQLPIDLRNHGSGWRMKNLPRKHRFRLGDFCRVFSVHYALCRRRNSSRGDRTPIELFLAGLAGWEGSISQSFPHA